MAALSLEKRRFKPIFRGPFVAVYTHMTSSSVAAAHVILFLAVEQARGRSVRLDELAEHVGIRRTDARAIVSRLHDEGHVDAVRLRVTMTGLAIAANLRMCKLRDVRAERPCGRDQMNVA
jgi:hypothetical protein